MRGVPPLLRFVNINTATSLKCMHMLLRKMNGAPASRPSAQENSCLEDESQKQARRIFIFF
jgi:hypothetical protein